MKLKPQVGGNGGEIVQVEPGTYEAVLEEVRGYRGKRYKSEEYEPKLVFIWNLGEDEDGNPIHLWDFVRLPRDREGYPVLNENSHLYARLAALYGEPFPHDDPKFAPEIAFPEEYDSPEGLESLPTFEEAKEEGFRPVTLRSLKVAGEELLGKEALVTVVMKETKNGPRSFVQNVSPKPKAKRPKVKRLEAEAEAAGAPL